MSIAGFRLDSPMWQLSTLSIRFTVLFSGKLLSSSPMAVLSHDIGPNEHPWNEIGNVREQ